MSRSKALRDSLRLGRWACPPPNLEVCSSLKSIILKSFARPQAILEDLVFRKVFQLLKIFGGSVECFLRNQPNNLSTDNLHARSFGFPAHGLVGLGDAGDFVVHNV